MDAKAQAPIVKLVDKILAAKRTDPRADVSGLEREVDARVSRLYGLPPEESEIVASASAVAPKAMADGSRGASSFAEATDKTQGNGEK